MKYFYGALLLLVVLAITLDLRAAELSLHSGNSYQRPVEKWHSQRDMYGVRLSGDYTYLQINRIEINHIAIGSGLRGVIYDRHFRFIGSFGVDHFDKPSQGYTTREWQFNVYLGADYAMTNGMFIGGGIMHNSNCKHLCRWLYDVDGPNIGLDWFLFRLGFVL